MNKIQIQVKSRVTSFDDSRMSHQFDKSIDYSNFNKATIIKEKTYKYFCEDDLQGACDNSHENTSLVTSQIRSLSNHVELGQKRFEKMEDKANIGGIFISPIECIEGWRTRDDLNSRCRLMEEVATQIIFKRTNRGPQKYLPKMVKELEFIFYRSAPSIHSYQNSFTLEERLDSLAMVLRRKMRTHTREHFQSKKNVAMGTLAMCDMKHKLQIPERTLRSDIENFQSKFKFQVRHKQGHSYAA